MNMYIYIFYTTDTVCVGDASSGAFTETDADPQIRGQVRNIDCLLYYMSN